ncbi:hypothetical protein [Nocardia sp. NPDC004604]|uniref:hypothetical protein n=1 Tax=Nocardia sp. NPDC004604 TaxID=3157013 RepID=UPI0033B504AA
MFGTPVAAGELDRHDHELSRMLDIDDDYTSDGREHQERQVRCAVLSERFGQAHWYGQNYESGCDDWWGWCLAADGKVQRAFGRPTHLLGTSPHIRAPTHQPTQHLSTGQHRTCRAASLFHPPFRNTPRCAAGV